jgi:hypothetical protein
LARSQSLRFLIQRSVSLDPREKNFALEQSDLDSAFRLSVGKPGRRLEHDRAFTDLCQAKKTTFFKIFLIDEIPYSCSLFLKGKTAGFHPVFKPGISPKFNFCTVLA